MTPTPPYQILFLPAPGDPAGLLANGVGGSRPPRAFQFKGAGPWKPGQPRGRSTPPHTNALLLVHEGNVVLPAYDLVLRACALAGIATGSILKSVMQPSIGLASLLALRAAHGGLGTVVVLDADGRPTVSP